jgi:hypothetical protein
MNSWFHFRGNSCRGLLAKRSAIRVFNNELLGIVDSACRQDLISSPSPFATLQIFGTLPIGRTDFLARIDSLLSYRIFPKANDVPSTANLDSSHSVDERVLVVSEIHGEKSGDMVTALIWPEEFLPEAACANRKRKSAPAAKARNPTFPLIAIIEFMPAHAQLEFRSRWP